MQEIYLPHDAIANPGREGQPYEPFDPDQELRALAAELHSMDKSERTAVRGQRFAELREKLYLQRESIARLSSKIEDSIRNNPDSSSDELRAMVQAEAPHARLCQNQLDQFYSKIDKYLEAHQSIETTLSSYQDKFGDNWQQELFKDMFGGYPKGKIKLNVEPMFLFWEIENIDDYMLPRTINSERSGGVAPTEEDREKLSKATGMPAFVFSYPVVDFIKAPIGVRYNNRSLKGKVMTYLAGELEQVHESRHATDSVGLGLYKNGTLDLRGYLESNLNSESSDEEIESAIEYMLKGGEKNVRRVLRSEIIATIEPAEMIFDINSGWKGFFFKNIVPKLLAFQSKRRPEKAIGRSASLIPLYIASFDDPSSRIQFVSRFWGLMMAVPEGSNYNYAQIGIDSTINAISKFTGKDFSRYIEDKVGDMAEGMIKEVVGSLVASEYIGSKTDLTPKQLLWMLQNEPFERWPLLANSLGKDSKEEFGHLFQQRMAELTALNG